MQDTLNNAALQSALGAQHYAAVNAYLHTNAKKTFKKIMFIIHPVVLFSLFVVFGNFTALFYLVVGILLAGLPIYQFIKNQYLGRGLKKLHIDDSYKQLLSPVLIASTYGGAYLHADQNQLLVTNAKSQYFVQLKDISGIYFLVDTYNVMNKYYVLHGAFGMFIFSVIDDTDDTTSLKSTSVTGHVAHSEQISAGFVADLQKLLPAVPITTVPIADKQQQKNVYIAVGILLAEVFLGVFIAMIVAGAKDISSGRV